VHTVVIVLRISTGRYMFPAVHFHLLALLAAIPPAYKPVVVGDGWVER